MADNKENLTIDEILKEYSPKSGGNDEDVESIIAQVNRISESSEASEGTDEAVSESEQSETDDVKHRGPDLERLRKPITNVFNKLQNDAEELDKVIGIDSETDDSQPIDEAKEQTQNTDEQQNDKESEQQPEESASNISDEQRIEADQEEKAQDEPDSNDEQAPQETVEEQQEEAEQTEKDEQAPESDDAPIYQRRKRNRGARFTLRTSDDTDESKIPSSQSEYTKRGQEKLICDQIIKLKNNLTVRIAVLLFASVFSLFLTIANDLSFTLTAVFDREVNPSAYLFANTILGIVAVGLSYSVVMSGISNIIKHHPDSDSIAALNILVAIIAGIATLFDSESLKASFFHLYTCVAIVGLLFNMLGKLSIVRRTLRNFEFVSSNDRFSAVQLVDDDNEAVYITNGSAGKRCELAAMKRTDFIKDFMKNSYSSDLADLYAEKTTPLILAAALVVALLSIFFEKNSASATEKLFVFLATFSGTLSICTSFGLTLIANLPLAKASKNLVDSSGVMLGYSSAEEFAEVNSVMIDAGHLFPTGTVEFINLKMLGSVMIDKAIVYAASMASAGKSVTQPAFYKMLRGNLDMLMPVKGCVSENNLGVSGWIDNKRVLLGSRELMERHQIDGLPPEEMQESFCQGGCVMYLAVSGRATMMFDVQLSVGASARRWVQELEDEGIEIHIRSSDGFINRELLSRMFDINPGTVHLLPSGCDSDYEQITDPCEEASASMFCSGHLPTFSMMLIAAKRVKASANIGVAVQYGQFILGVVLCVIMMVMGSFSQITPTIVIIYNLAFLLITWLMQAMKRV